MLPNTEIIGDSNIILFTLLIMALTKDISTAALVYTWQLVEHAKSLSVTFILMLFNCINIKGLGTCVIVWLPLIGSVPP